MLQAAALKNVLINLLKCRVDSCEERVLPLEPANLMAVWARCQRWKYLARLVHY